MEFAGGAVDPDLEILTISTNTYAVFQSKGKMPDAFIDPYHKVVTEFFSQSTQYEYAENVEFEVYFSANTADLNYTCEIRDTVDEKTRYFCTEKRTAEAIDKHPLWGTRLRGCAFSFSNLQTQRYRRR